MRESLAKSQVPLLLRNEQRHPCESTSNSVPIHRVNNTVTLGYGKKLVNRDNPQEAILSQN